MIKGFSKHTKEEKQKYIQRKILSGSKDFLLDVELKNPSIQKVIDSLSENVIASFPFPYSIAPNF